MTLKGFSEYLQEGVYDPSIFKLFFLAGGPGSGKSYVEKRVTRGLGLKLVNSDSAFEHLMKSAKQSLDFLNEIEPSEVLAAKDRIPPAIEKMLKGDSGYIPYYYAVKFKNKTKTSFSKIYKKTEDEVMKYISKKYPGGTIIDVKKVPKKKFEDMNSSDRMILRNAIRNKAKQITNNKMGLYVHGRLGLIIDGTAKDYAKIKKQKEALQRLGYEPYMIFVNTSLEVALERNARRERKVPEDIVKQSHKDVQQNIGRFQGLFGKDFLIIDNNNAKDDILNMAYKQVKKFAAKPPKTKLAQQWIKSELEKKKRK